MIGYYTRIDGIAAPIAAAKDSEKTACFAFRTGRSPVRITREGEKFRVVALNPDSPLDVYYHPFPARDFAKPATFAEVQLIATFRARSGEALFTPGGEFNYAGTIELESSADFVHEGRKYNFRDFGSAFTLQASGSSPSPDEIIEQMSKGIVRLPFTGFAAKAAP